MPRLLRPTVVAMAVLVAGCGSSEQQKPPLTQAQYKAKANAICRAAAKKAIPFPGKRSGSGLITTAKLITPYLEKSLKTERAALAQMKALSPPPSQKKQV